MSQTVYYKILISFLVFVAISDLNGKLLRPSNNRKDKEILLINSKRRVYYPIKDSGLIYNISGPNRIEFISRYPVLRKKKKSHSYSYNIVLNKTDTIDVNHKYKVQSKIKSVQHPKHSYTFSGNYFINIPKGQHTIELIKRKKSKYPVLVRVLSKEFESLGKKQKVLNPMIHKDGVLLDISGKRVQYYECSNEIPLQVKASGPSTLRILSRLQFSEIMGNEESYRIHVMNGKKVEGTYYFNTERSSSSSINNRSDKVPGKWRSCEIKVPKGSYTYNIEISDKGKTVLTRFILY